MPGSVCGSVSRRGASAGGLDTRRNKPDSSDDHTLGAFVKITFKIPKSAGANMAATLARETRT